MAEITFCKQFLQALDARPAKLSSDHIADARNYPASAAFILPRLPSPHPTRPNAPKSASGTTSSSTSLTLTLKPLKATSPTVTLPSIPGPQTSIFDLKSAYSAQTSIPASKIKILYKKKPVGDAKTVSEVVGGDAADGAATVEFGVMVMGGAVASPAQVQSPPAVAPEAASEEAKGLAGVAAQGPSGKEVVATDEFWGDLKGFIMQRIRDEKEGERLVGVFKTAWEGDR
ncbi:hypothetical protein BS50DRAFT_536675 [Corynespora cassiicola Philippines]|uniref:Ubiquitin-like domain-containing protein n=1 Tax=Corynespora cassiicola Philippines TaxID=1448308 RepID=A0A2T2N355_CORCC|nr:hypothetical protein BS50DRAFT_536675 [Corynespora cassiicola Philippines]